MNVMLVAQNFARSSGLVDIGACSRRSISNDVQTVSCGDTSGNLPRRTYNFARHAELKRILEMLNRLTYLVFSILPVEAHPVVS